MPDPTAALTTPVATEKIPPLVDTFLHIGDLISLGHWAMVAIDMMGGPNIPEEVGEWFAGDWEEVSKSASALRNLGDFCTYASENVDADLEVMLEKWDGKASAAAGTYFLELAERLGEQKAAFYDIADQYEATAFGVKELANACGSLVESLADYAIAAGISLLAAASNSWNPFGWGAAGAAAYSIYKGTETVRKIIEIRAKVWTACEALMGLIAGSLGSIKGFESVSLPAPYDNPQVA